MDQYKERSRINENIVDLTCNPFWLVTFLIDDLKKDFVSVGQDYEKILRENIQNSEQDELSF